MLKTEKWAQHINPVVAYLAINHAMIAREKSAALRTIRERCIYGYQFPLPDLKSWFSMYQSRLPLFAYKNFISISPEKQTTSKLFLMRAFRWVERQVKQNPDKFKKLERTPEEREKSLQLWRNFCSETYDEIMEEIADTTFDPETREKIVNSLQTDELPLGFYFLVYAPCQLFYGKSPSILYRNSLTGDLTAIENLLKLDPLILHDSSIGYQIQSVRLNGKINDYERLIAAVSKRPNINYKQLSDERKSIKSDHAAQIYVLSKAMNEPLEVPQIRELYDALAQDLDRTLIDTDIKKPEGFDKTIRTKAATWQKQLQHSEKQN